MAESFESPALSPALGDHATKLEELFAEDRGTTTRRVAMCLRDKASERCYEPILVKIIAGEGGSS